MAWRLAEGFLRQTTRGDLMAEAEGAGLRRRHDRTAPAVRRPLPRITAARDQLLAKGAAAPPDALQWALGLAIVLGPVAALVLWPAMTGPLLHAVFYALFSLAAGSRIAAAAIGPMRVESPALPTARLPRYTIIAPLHREAEVAPDLIEALRAIDYPPAKLQAILVLEADDEATRRAIARLDPPPWIEVLIAPPGQPRTKPRACNIALDHARGELVTIYDAEDRPDPGQLREAASRFATGSPRLACLQAPLRIDDDHRFLPRQFALEYAAQFEVMLPFLVRIGAPFPLGGTSNHFRTTILRQIGGWDPWNVTEDAEIGFRLAAEGYELGVLARPTWEPAPDRLVDWLPQRARWVKGYLQTLGVLLRTPPHWRTGVAAAFAMTLGVAVASAILNGPLLAWLLSGLAIAALGGHSVAVEDLILLVFGWSAASLAATAGMLRSGRRPRLMDLITAPLYWPLHALAAVHAIRQLITRPHHWDKTPHRPRTGQVAA